MRGLLIVALTLVMMPARASAQVSASDLAGALADLTSSVNALPMSLRSTRLLTAVEWLNSRSVKADLGVMSRDYVASLSRAAGLLRKQPGAEAVEDVTSELEAKVEHCRKLGVGMGGSVLVKVNTRRGLGTVSGLEVLYLLKFDDWLRTPARNFARMSSPTEMTIDPGRYWVWARDPANGTTSDRVLIQVAGQKEVTIDLAVR